MRPAAFRTFVYLFQLDVLFHPVHHFLATAFHSNEHAAQSGTLQQGEILVGDGPNKEEIGKLSASDKLKKAGIAYILQDKSVFPGMTVEENLWMGGFLKDKPQEAKEAA